LGDWARFEGAELLEHFLQAPPPPFLAELHRFATGCAPFARSRIPCGIPRKPGHLMTDTIGTCDEVK
jgi:hypothetical protein